MTKIVQILTTGDLVWTLRDGELTAWRVRPDGNLERIAGDLMRQAYEELPNDDDY